MSLISRAKLNCGEHDEDLEKQEMPMGTYIYVCPKDGCGYGLTRAGTRMKEKKVKELKENGYDFFTFLKFNLGLA